jgi:hypothetical protein
MSNWRRVEKIQWHDEQWTQFYRNMRPCMHARPSPRPHRPAKVRRTWDNVVGVEKPYTPDRTCQWMAPKPYETGTK